MRLKIALCSLTNPKKCGIIYVLGKRGRLMDKIKFVIKGNTIKRNELHFEAQLRNKAHVFRDRTKYTRKTKHRNKF